MKKKIVALLIAFMHKQSLAALVTATTAGASVGIVTSLTNLSPEIWAFSTFGAVFVYMNHKVEKRNRLVNLGLSVILGVFGSDVSAAYIRKSLEIDSSFLTGLMALLIAATWPWVFEKLLGAKK